MTSLADASAKSHEFLEGPYVRIPKEMGCAAAASLMVTPLVSILDKAIASPIKGIGPFMTHIGTATKEMVTKPVKFVSGLAFRLTFVVYFGTYAAANLSEAALDFYKVRDDAKRKQIKVAGVTAANIALLGWRDSVFAREFLASGSGSAKPKVPLRTVSMFALRDFGTMTATFYGAPKAAQYLRREYDWNKDAANLSMALFVPVVSQYITAPIHIHAMDYYVRPQSNERMKVLAQEYNKVSFARAMRILPAFGLGSFANNKLRELSIRQPDEELLLTRKITRLVQRVSRPINRNKVVSTSPSNSNN